jgi:hypothetical protein
MPLAACGFHERLHDVAVWRMSACLLMVALTGCASVSAPRYCDSAAENIRYEVNQYQDWDIAWMGIALTWVGLECPCPESTDSEGRKCGARSAYSRSGGSSPLCYPEEIPRRQIPAVREELVRRAAPIECGGLGVTGITRFGKTPPESIPVNWK